MKVTLCTECEHCPEVELTDQGVRIGESGNVALLTHKEWNLLVDWFSAANSRTSPSNRTRTNAQQRRAYRAW